MPTTSHCFHLSPKGKLRTLIAVLLLVPPQLLAEGLTVAEGVGAAPQVHMQGGVPVIDIVAPDAGGLSHNQFLDYNVERQGLVLNNAVQVGISQLAGSLAGNEQFHGQAASVILNEVISRNASTLNGTQEIFGRAADYVLANPNGISVNGASFINTPNVQLVVGRPQLLDGKLDALNTYDARGQLTVREHGLQNPEGSLHLIAPQIDSQGLIKAHDDLNLTMGRNTVEAASGQVREVDPASQAQDSRIDARLFGAMQAGRINIVSTAQGAGVKMGAVLVEGRDGVTVNSAGDLDISGKAQANSLDVSRATLSSRQGDVVLHSADNLKLSATDVRGRDVVLDAGRNLTLSSLESRKLQEQREQWDHHNFLFTYETFDRTSTDEQSRQHGNRIAAGHAATLTSGGTSAIQASSVEAGDTLRINSTDNLRLIAADETHVTRDRGAHRKHLWKANWDESSRDQRSVTSSLKAGQHLELNSQQTVQLQGADVQTPGNIQINARAVDISSVADTHTRSGKAYSGDLVGGSFFGNKGGDDQGKTAHVASKVNADGALIVRADNVKISASQVHGGQQASVISDKGSLVIDGVNNTSHDSSYRLDSQLFGLTKHEARKDLKSNTHVASQLRSDSNLTLKSAKDLTLRGSQVTAQGDLNVLAKGDINIDSAQNTTHEVSQTHTRGFTGYTLETAQGSHQFRAGVRYEDQKQAAGTDSTVQQGATLSGGTLVVNAGHTLNAKGAELKATRGDASLSAQQIELMAAHDSTTTTTDQSKSGGGVYYTAGLDKAGSGIEGGQQSQHGTLDQVRAQVSGVNAAGKLSVWAADKLSTQGAQISAGDALQVTAARVDNQAARTTESSTHAQSNWQAESGVNVEYKGITRPIEKKLQQLAQGSFKDALKPLSSGAANLGLDVDGASSNLTRSGEDSTATASRFSGGAVQVNVAGTLQDQGTHYSANQGELTIKAGSHDATAALDTHQSHQQGLTVKVGGRLYTSTGEDLNTRLNGSGGSQDQRKQTQTALVGSFSGAQGVSIDIKGDARYEGSQFNGHEGGISLNAGENLALNQANNLQSETGKALEGSGSLTLGTSGETNVNASVGAKLHGRTLQTDDSQPLLATLQGGGPINLRSGGNLILQGSQLGHGSDKTGAIRLDAGGKLDLQAASATHSKRSNEVGGGIELGASIVHGAESDTRKGNLNASLNVANVSEHDRTLTASQLYSNANVTLASGARSADAIHLEGTRIQAPSVNVSAENGGVVQAAAQSSQRHNNWGVALGTGLTEERITPLDPLEPGPAAKAPDLSGQAKLDIDRLNVKAPQQSVIDADLVTASIGTEWRRVNAQPQSSTLKVNLEARSDGDKK